MKISEMEDEIEKANSLLKETSDMKNSLELNNLYLTEKVESLEGKLANANEKINNISEIVKNKEKQITSLSKIKEGYE